jgi:hypothetical protein
MLFSAILANKLTENHPNHILRIADEQNHGCIMDSRRDNARILSKAVSWLMNQQSSYYHTLHKGEQQVVRT